MSVQSAVANELVQDGSSVWMLQEHQRFDYSDGAESEAYLRRVLQQARDISSTSHELETYIKDWPSEYHLTPKRAQLLAGFDFDRSQRVLEVGCGCGAITRYLGEHFDHVISVEGSLARARLAKLRTRDLPSVSVMCAPFQKISFRQKFDLIFCVGVFEYSASFVDAADPYDEVLRYFDSILTANGKVVIAIENQFGLKYFSAHREDHLGIPFEGIEGYRGQRGRVRTFGRTELTTRLRKYFAGVEYYYPYPDYKLPDCVVAEEFLASGEAGEIVSQMRPRDYVGKTQPLWDESLVALELSRNGALPFFANSFLAVATKSDMAGVSFPQLATLFSSGRKRGYRTRTRVCRDATGALIVRKTPISRDGAVYDGRLELVAADSDWMNGYSLQTEVYLRCKSRAYGLQEMFEPCRGWLRLLETESVLQSGTRYVEGRHIDSVWSNVYGDAIVDREWVWKDRIRLNVVVIRAIYAFLIRFEEAARLSRELSTRSGRRLITEIARAIGATVDASDFAEFVALEAAFHSSVYNTNPKRHALFIRGFLFDRALTRYALSKRVAAREFAVKVRRKLTTMRLSMSGADHPEKSATEA